MYVWHILNNLCTEFNSYNDNYILDKALVSLNLKKQFPQKIDLGNHVVKINTKHSILFLIDMCLDWPWSWGMLIVLSFPLMVWWGVTTFRFLWPGFQVAMVTNEAIMGLGALELFLTSLRWPICWLLVEWCFLLRVKVSPCGFQR